MINNTNNINIMTGIITIAEMLGEMFAPFVEVIVHDYQKPEASVVFIANGHITGRAIGSALTDLGIKRLAGEVIPDRLVGYSNTAPDGRPLKSSSLAFRDSNGEYLAALCLNVDVSFFDQIRNVLDVFLKGTESKLVGKSENFNAITPSAEIRKAIDNWNFENANYDKQLSADDKRKLVFYLLKNGHFNKRGAVSIVADELSISRPTVYRYLEEANNGTFI